MENTDNAMSNHPSLSVSRYLRQAIDKLFTPSLSLIVEQYTQVIGFSVRQLGAQITDNSIKASLLNKGIYSDPDIAGALEALDDHGIAYSPAQMSPFDANLLPEIPRYSLLYMQDGSLATFDKVTSESAYLFDTQQKQLTLTLAEFEGLWSGIFVELEISSAIQEREFYEERQSEILQKLQYPLLTTGSLVAAVSVLSYVFSSLESAQKILWSTLMLINVLAAVISVVLAKFYIDGKSKAIASICKKNDNTNGCLDLLNDANAKLFSIPHADIGVAFFLGNIVLLLATPTLSSLLTLNAFLAIFYSVYSIYYQAIVKKTWCKLCLIVQALVLLQATIIVRHLSAMPNNIDTELGYTSLMLQIALFIVPAMGWAIFRQLSAQAKKALAWEVSSRQALFSAQGFEFFTQHVPTIEQQSLPGDLILGTDESPTEVMLVLSLACPRCHIILNQVLNITQSDAKALKLCIRLISNDKTRDISRNITALSARGDNTATLSGIQSWFEHYKMMDLEGWLAEHPQFSDSELSKADDMLNESNQWFELVGGQYTPSVYVNNKLMPDEYLGKEAEIIKVLT